MTDNTSYQYSLIVDILAEMVLNYVVKNEANNGVQKEEGANGK